MSSTFASSYTRAHTAAYVSDKMRNLIKLLVQHYGLDPTALVDAWSDWVDRAARTWLQSGHLQKIIIEFYKPGTTVALGRWDFPMGNHQQLIESITQRLWPMGGETAFVPGHGPMSTFAHERATNPLVGDRVLAAA